MSVFEKFGRRTTDCPNGEHVPLPDDRGDAWEGEEPPPVPFGRVIPCAELRATSHADLWIGEGFLARESTTLLSAMPKVGKTTLLAHKLRAMENGSEFCGRKMQASRVLYVTEESETRWAERRDELSLGNHLSFMIRPFLNKPDAESWRAFLTYCTGILKTRPVDVIVFDTISNLWPVVNENDASEVTAALMPLRTLTNGAALLLVHHLKKGDGKEGTGSRGSGALTAWVDIIIEVRRYQPDNLQDRRRVLTGFGRWDDVLSELVVELLPDGTAFRGHGDKQAMVRAEIRNTLLAVLPTEAPGFTYDQIGKEWPEEEGPRRQTLIGVLKQGADLGTWIRSGDGKKGSPYRFWASVRYTAGTERQPDDAAT